MEVQENKSKENKKRYINYDNEIFTHESLMKILNHNDAMAQYNLKCDSYIKNTVRSMSDFDLIDLCYDAVVCDRRFRVVPAASGKKLPGGHHHVFPGGLLMHTAQVMEYALQNIFIEDEIKADRDVLIAAALFHDSGKMFDYIIDWENSQIKLKEDENYYDHTETYDLIYHISSSYELFKKAVDRHEYKNEKKVLQIGHAILAHHGNYGRSPVEPKTLEAQIIHHADVLSAFYAKIGGSRTAPRGI